MSASPLTFEERREWYADSVADLLGRWGPLFLLTGMRGNVGDQLIWRGTDELLASRGLSAERVPVTDHEPNGQRPLTRRLGCLVIPGSGAFTGRWHEWLPALVATASLSFERVVILPSEYDPSVDVVATALRHSNVFAFAREVQSFRALRSFGRAALAFDPALYLSVGDDLAPLDARVPVPPEPSGEVLVALREDQSSELVEAGASVVDDNHDISVRCDDLHEFLDAVRAADSIVTDRLHVTVAAMLLGRPVWYSDPAAHKISRYLDFVTAESAQRVARQVDVAWLLDHGFARRIES